MHISVHSQCSYFWAVVDILSRFRQKNNNNNYNITNLICLTISVHAKVLCNHQFSRGLNLYGNIDKLAVLVRGGTVTSSKLFANHNALGQLTNHNTFRFSEGGPSSNPELIESFVSGWGERGIVIMNHQAWEHVLVCPQNKIKTL